MHPQTGAGRDPLGRRGVAVDLDATIEPKPRIWAAARGVPGVVGQGRVPDPAHGGVRAQAEGQLGGVGLGSLDTQRERPQPPQGEPDLLRPGDAAGEVTVCAAAGRAARGRRRRRG